MKVDDSFLTINDTGFLNDDFLLVEVLAELCRRTSFMLAEQAVEVRERIEAGVITYFSSRHGGINQHSRSKAQANLDDIVRQGAACTLVEEAGKGYRCHPCQLCNLLKTHFFAEMTRYVLLHFADATALTACLNVCKRRAGQGAAVIGQRQVVKQFKEAQHRMEAVPVMCQFV